MRRTMRSRLSTGHLLFDALVIGRATHDVLHEDARSMDAVGIELTGLDQLFDFGYGMSRRGGHHRIEVARGFPVDEIAEAIALPRFHEREVGVQRRLEDEWPAVDDSALLSFSDSRAGPGGSEEAADAGARGAHPFGERALR